MAFNPKDFYTLEHMGNPMDFTQNEFQMIFTPTVQTSPKDIYDRSDAH